MNKVEEQNRLEENMIHIIENDQYWMINHIFKVIGTQNTYNTVEKQRKHVNSQFRRRNTMPDKGWDDLVLLSYGNAFTVT